MRPIDNETLLKLRGKLAEAREAEYQALIEVANCSFWLVDTKLDDLRDARQIVLALSETIDRLNHDGLVKTGNTEGDIYTQGAPHEALGDW